MKTFFFSFFWRALALVSLVLGLEHSCPWPRERLSSERLSLAMASDFFVSLASGLVSSTPPLVMTKRVRTQVQASEMRFLQKIERVTLFNKLRSSEIRKSLNIEPLLLRIERSQLRWFGHVSRMPQDRLPQTSFTCQSKWEKTSWTT